MPKQALVVALVLSSLVGCAPRCELGRVCEIIGTGELGFNGDGLDALETRVASPTAVGVDPQGRPLVVDYSNMRLRVLDDEGTVQTLVGNGFHAYSEVGSPALDTPLENPVDAGWGPDGLLYILPQHEGRVIRIEGGKVERFAGTGVIDDTGDGGPAVDATMGYGGGLAWAEDGTLFVADNTYSRVRRVSPDGTMSTVLGVGERSDALGKTGPETGLAGPERMVVNEDAGELWVADARNHRVLAVDLDTLEVRIAAGGQGAGFSGDGGSATNAQLNNPVGLAVRDGVVFISDFDNNVIRRVRDGQIDTIAGMLDPEDPKRSAVALDFPLEGPSGLAWDRDDLLIAERLGQRVLRWVGAADAL